MLTIEVVAVGKMSQSWFAQGVEEYQKRLSAFARVVVTEIAEVRPASDSSAAHEEAMEKEGEAILKVLESDPRAARVALCIEGKSWSSTDLASFLEKTKQETSHVFFVIGGSDGLSNAVKRACPHRISMSAMTFPHQMARMILMEQLYRAETIQNQMKYHK